MGVPRFFRFAIISLVVLLTACGDLESDKKRLIETGKKYYDAGKFKEASIIFRKAIQKDARFGQAYFELGKTELKRGNYGDGIRAYQRASELQPENENAHSTLGDLYISIFTGDPKRHKILVEDALGLAERLLKRDPKDFTALRIRGFVGLAHNDLKEAAVHFRKALAIKPNEPKVTLALAQTVAAQGNEEESVAMIRESIAKNRDFIPLYDFLFRLMLKQKKVDEAEKVLVSKMTNNPKMSSAYLELSTFYLRTNKQAEAKAVLEKILSNPKDFPNGRDTIGDYYYRIGRLQDALEHYDQAAKAAPEGKRKASYQKKMAEVMAVMGRREESLKLVEELVKRDSEDAEARALRAALRLQSGKKEEVSTAISEFQSVLSKMPNNPVVRFNLGEAHMTQGALDKAIAQYQEALKLSPTYLPAKLALARVYLTQRDHAKSLQLSDEMIQQAPNLVPPRLLRISSLIGLNDAKTARAETNQLLQANSNIKDARYLLASLDYAEQKMTEAEAGFRLLWQSTPPDNRGLFGLGEVYMETGRSEQARQILESELKKTNARPVRMALANIQVRTKKYAEALEHYQLLAKENPQSADLQMRIGETYRRWGKLDQAFNHFEKASQLSPKDELPYIQMVALAEVLGRQEKVKPLYTKILEVSPDNPVALNNLAYMMAEAGTDLDQALTYAQRARQKMPTNLDIADTLGWIYIKKNLSEDAIKIFRDLVEKKPDHVTWRYHLAIALFQKGDKLAAKKELQTALRNSPSKEEDKKIQELLGRIG
ncbi:MAG: tetratricopeptide repeat protein [Acidimicrobiia bacterium]|nr:tetratricopeptide repeat protein [Acidimicrobiia bacterium]